MTSALSVQPAYPIFTDVDGSPLEDGYIWLGGANLDPQTNPTNVYWDAALTIPAAQPIRTLAGYPSNSGTPARLYVANDYSVRVMNKTGSAVYTSNAVTERYSNVIISSVSAQDVIYTPPYSGSVSSTLQDWAAKYVSVLDFGADPSGSANSDLAFTNAIKTGKIVYAPAGEYLIGSPISITNSGGLVGDGITKTVINRNYSPQLDTDGIFNIRDGGTGFSMENLSLQSLEGQTGGCLVSLVNTQSSFGLFKFSHMNFRTTGASTHKYTFYADGTGAATSPVGIRGLDMHACAVFGGEISTLLIKGVSKFSFLGGGAYTAGGAATSNIRFDGTVQVPTQGFLFQPSECSCPISFDRAKLGVVGCGILGAIQNTSNTENIFVYGFSGSVQQNWDNSFILNTSTGLSLTANQRLTNKGSAALFPVEMKGPITGFQKSGTVTQIGQTGVSYSTGCPHNQSFSFTTSSAKLFTISTGGGAAAVVFADYQSATVTLLSNPSNVFQASASPGAGLTGIFKSANNHVIQVKNNTGALVYYSILSLGSVGTTSDPA